MGQYTPKKFSRHAIVPPTDLAAELTAIGAAYGDAASHDLDDTNFPETTRYIPNGSLDYPNSLSVLTLKYNGTVTGAVSYGTRYAQLSIPHGLIVKQLTFICTAVTGTVQARVGGNEQTLFAAATAYTTTSPATTQHYQNQALYLEIQAGAGESIANVRCDIVCYNNHIAEALPR